MRVTIGGLLSGLTGFAAVFSLYAKTAFNVPSAQTTPIMAALIATGLGGLFVLGLSTGRYRGGRTAGREASIWLLLAGAIPLAVFSVLWETADRTMTFSDWGVVAIQLGTPLLLVFNEDRGNLLIALGRWCVLFAFADLAANLLDAFDVIHLVKHVGENGTDYGLHYLGLPESSFAEGIVATVAATWLARGLTESRGLAWLARAVLIVALLYSLMMIGSRAYLGLALVGVAALVFRLRLRIWHFLIIALIAGGGLFLTFTADYSNFDDRLRRMLIEGGFVEALRHPFIGIGVTYRGSSNLIAEFWTLSRAGVTESGALDLAVSYGVCAAFCFVASAVLAACSWRPRASWPAVLLALFVAQIAWSDLLTSLLGSLLFFTALTWVQRDEVAG
jgi:hypothetical protein